VGGGGKDNIFCDVILPHRLKAAPTTHPPAPSCGLFQSRKISVGPQKNAQSGSRAINGEARAAPSVISSFAVMPAAGSRKPASRPDTDPVPVASRFCRPYLRKPISIRAENRSIDVKCAR
jgi:hypothetical protein